MTSKTILMIDDSESDQFLTQQTIKSCAPDIEFISALGGADALSLLEARPDIDVILLDINMPEMNGFEFLDAYMKRANVTFRVYLMLGAALSAEHAEKATNYPCLEGFIFKPLKRDDIDGIFSGV